MSEEYIHIEEHKQIVNTEKVKGIIIWELERLCQVHAAEPHTLQVLQIVLKQFTGEAA